MNFLFFCENTMFSGGRYFTVFVASALCSLGHKVTFVTNRKPIFFVDFKDVLGFKDIQWIIDVDCHYQERGYDLVVTVPKKGGMVGYKYSMSNATPLYALIFETPNFSIKYRKGADAYESYWTGYKEHLLHAKKIITISEESKKYIEEWIKCFPDKVDVIHPCVNNIVADTVPEVEKTNSIVCISRFIEFKKVEDVIKAASKVSKDIEVIYITSEQDIYGVYQRVKLLATQNKMSIKVFTKVSDKQKYELLKQSKLLVHPSSFEGFGLPPAEALYAGIPVIVYDLPVYKSFYGDTINYVPLGNIDALSHKIEQLSHKVEHPIKREFRNKLKYERLVQDVKKVFFAGDIRRSIKELTLEEF